MIPFAFWCYHSLNSKVIDTKYITLFLYNYEYPKKGTFYFCFPGIKLRKMSQNFKLQIVCYFLVASEDNESKTGILKSLNRKPSYSSFTSTWCTDFRYTVFLKNHWAPFEVVEVKRSFSRWLRRNFIGWKISIHGNFEPLGCTLSPCGSRWFGL